MKSFTKSAVLMGAGALALASGNALAQSAEIGKATVSFYGLVDVWVGSSESRTSGKETLQLGSGGMSTSFLGVNGSMPIAPGLSAVAAAEMFFRPDTAEQGRYGGTSTDDDGDEYRREDEFFARSAYVGLQGDFGLLKAGRNTSPYFLPTILFNPFGDSFVFSPMVLHTFQNGNFGPIVGDSGWSNSVSYTTPTVAGFSATVVYAFGEVEDEEGDNKVGGNIFYRNGGFAATLAAHQVQTDLNFGTAANLGELPFQVYSDVEDQTAYLAGLSYDFGVAKLFGQYQMLETGTAGGDGDTDTYQVGVSVPLGGGKVLASYAFSDFDYGALEDERSTVTVGYDYNFTKSFDVYAAVMHDEVDSQDHDALTYGVGGRYRF